MESVATSNGEMGFPDGIWLWLWSLSRPLCVGVLVGGGLEGSAMHFTQTLANEPDKFQAYQCSEFNREEHAEAVFCVTEVQRVLNKVQVFTIFFLLLGANAIFLRSLNRIFEN